MENNQSLLEHIEAALLAVPSTDIAMSVSIKGNMVQAIMNDEDGEAPVISVMISSLYQYRLLNELDDRAYNLLVSREDGCKVIILDLC